MIFNFKINFWDIQGYINVNPNFKKQIKQKILSRTSINKFATKTNTTSMSLYLFLNNENNFIRIRNLIRILDLLKIPKSLAEKNIIFYRDTSSKEAFKISFPYHFSPIDMRIIGLLFGDGNIHKKNGMARWIQKDTTPLKKLIEKSLNIRIKAHTNEMQVTIPAFLTKIATKVLDLEQLELACSKIIEKSLKLPNDYKLALLLAIIEDEGNIDVKNYGGVSIRISSERGIKNVKEICNSLNYKTSNIKKYQNNGNFGNNIMYKLNIPSEGIEKLGFDLINFEKKYGLESSLWKKRNSFFQRWNICIGDKSKKNKEGSELHKKILSFFKEQEILSPKEVAVKFNEKSERIWDLMRRMCNYDEIERIKKGLYKLNKKLNK